MEKDNNISSQMRKGMLEYCVLLTLRQKGACYPNDLITRLGEVKMIVVEGTIYTLLNRLRKEGKLEYEWQESPKGPPRKYYRLTEAGAEALGDMTKVWDELSFAVDSLRVNHIEEINENNMDSEDLYINTEDEFLDNNIKENTLLNKSEQ